MVCKKCGAEIKEDDKFCPLCGKQLKAEETNISVNQVEQSVDGKETASLILGILSF